MFLPFFECGFSGGMPARVGENRQLPQPGDFRHVAHPGGDGFLFEKLQGSTGQEFLNFSLLFSIFLNRRRRMNLVRL